MAICSLTLLRMLGMQLSRRFEAFLSPEPERHFKASSTVDENGFEAIRYSLCVYCSPKKLALACEYCFAKEEFDLSVKD